LIRTCARKKFRRAGLPSIDPQAKRYGSHLLGIGPRCLCGVLCRFSFEAATICMARVILRVALTLAMRLRRFSSWHQASSWRTRQNGFELRFDLLRQLLAGADGFKYILSLLRIRRRNSASKR